MSDFSLVVDKTSLKLTTIATALIAAKFFITITIQGGQRFASGSRPPEDMALGLNKKMGKGRDQSFGLDPAGKDDDVKARKARLSDLRWQRIVMNDVENLPMGVIAMWTSLLTSRSPLAHTIFSLIFVGARYTHTYAYVKQLQPARALAWFSAWIGVFGLVANSVVGVLTI
ncbi:hypothetical protein BC829DRAFT_443587 [Chytridium lagenaria]|nr:hypothetical protein BC829DRAFT_443587 [Chytridium lagenaria]